MEPELISVSEVKIATILCAITKVKKAVERIPKTGRNEFYKYDYATEGDVLAALRPAMAEAGLHLIPSVESSKIEPIHETKAGAQRYRCHVRLRVILAHDSGAVWPDPIYWEGIGMDGEDKMEAKAITSAQKYGLLKFFMVETGTDPDADGTEAQKRKQPPKRPPMPATVTDVSAPPGWIAPVNPAPSMAARKASAPSVRAVSTTPVSPAAPPNPTRGLDILSTEQQRTAIHTLLNRKAVTANEYREQYLAGYKVASSKDLTFAQAGELIQIFSKMQDAAGGDIL